MAFRLKNAVDKHIALAKAFPTHCVLCYQEAYLAYRACVLTSQALFPPL